MLQVRRFSLGLMVALVAYAIYALAVVPFVEPKAPIVDSNEETPPPRHSELRERAAKIFASGAWERDSPKMLEAEQGMLFMRDYEQQPDGKVKITPCTFVVFAPGETQADGQRAPSRPFIVRAPEGAILQFERVDMNRGNPGKLLGGRLVGDVTIDSPETAPGKNDRVAISTRLVEIALDRISTLNEVRFQFGPHRGAGRDLTISFDPPGEESSDHDEVLDGKRAGAFRGIKQLELVHVDELELQSPAGKGLLGDDSSPTGDSPANETLPVEIACLGPFLFDFERQVASFEEQVDVLRANRDGPSDQLNCERLEIHFGEPPEDATGGERPGSPGKDASLGGMRIRKIVALGDPVILRAPASNANGRGDRLEYDFSRREVSLADAETAIFEQGPHRIEARKLRYALVDGNRLGALRALGPGKLEANGPGNDSPPTSDGATGEAPSQTATIRWRRELFLRPHETGHLVSLDGGASVDLSGSGGFSAEEIFFWFHEIAAPSERGAGDLKTSFRPDRLLARKRVAIAAEQLEGETERLEIWFDESGEVAEAPGELQRREMAPPTRTGVAATPIAMRPQEEAEPVRRKFRVAGKLIQVLLVAGAANEPGRMEQPVSGEYAPREIIIDGAASFGEVAGGPEPPLSVTGASVHAQKLDTPAAFISVLAGDDASAPGKPARVAARGVTILGGNLQFDQGKNRVWVDGPGELTFPPPRSRPAGEERSGDQRRGASSFTLGAQDGARPSAPVTISWTGRLNFDGRTAHFERQVEVSSGQSSLKCETLDAMTSRPIDFSALDGDSPPSGEDRAELRRLECKGGVIVENRVVDVRGETTAIEELHTRNLEIDQATGEIRADGAGHVVTVRRQSERALSGVSSRGPSRGPALPAPPARSPGLVYLRVDFQNGLTGNLLPDKRHVAFHENVEAVYGPVNDWKQTLDARDRDNLGEKGVSLTCDDLTITELPASLAGSREGGGRQSGSNERPLEIVAEGNAFVDSRSFAASAARLSYALDKEMLVLEGDGRANAEIWRRAPDGGPEAHNASRKITYLRTRDHVLLDDVEVLDVNELGAR